MLAIVGKGQMKRRNFEGVGKIKKIAINKTRIRTHCELIKMKTTTCIVYLLYAKHSKSRIRMR